MLTAYERKDIIAIIRIMTEKFHVLCHIFEFHCRKKNINSLWKIHLNIYRLYIEK